MPAIAMPPLLRSLKSLHRSTEQNMKQILQSLQIVRNKMGVYVDSGTGDCLGHLLDVDHSRQTLQIRIARDHFGFLVFAGRVHNRIGHC